MIGYIERIDSIGVTGWVYDPERPSHHHSITIFLNNAVIGTTSASSSRADLAAAGIGDGDHAFLWLIDKAIKNFDPRNITVKADDWEIPVDDNIFPASLPSSSPQLLALDHATSTVIDHVSLVKDSGLFSSQYASKYVSEDDRAEFNRDPLSFLLNDRKLTIKPHPLFDPKWYYNEYRAQIENDVHPLTHYLTSGIALGNLPNYAFIPEWYLSYLSDVDAKKASKNPLLHYYRDGWRKNANPHPMFNVSWYLSQHADIRKANIEPLSHYLDVGYRESRKIHPLFDVKYYSQYCGDHAIALDHFWRIGVIEGHAPHELLFYEAERNSRISPYTPPLKLSPVDAWARVNAPNNHRDIHVRTAVSQLIDPPFLSIIVPVYDPPLDIFRDAILSALTQSYTNFEIIIVDDASRNEAVRDEIAKIACSDKRIKAIYHDKNTHISISTNDAVDRASGEYIVFLDHDDVLMPNALAILAVFIDQLGRPDVLYSDDCRTDISGKLIQSLRFKPDWSPETLMSYSYASHLRSVKREIYQRIGGSRTGLEGSQDHDMFLRLATGKVTTGHIPHVLYGRRAIPGSTALGGGEKPYSFDAGRRAVKDALASQGINVDVTRPDWAIRHGLGIYRPVMPHSGPTVTLIIPTRNNVRTLVRLIRSLSITMYSNFDVLIVNNDSDDPDTIAYLARSPYKVINIKSEEDGFNFSRLNNLAVKQIDSDYVLFLNDDTEVLSPDWLSQMMGWAQIPGVGVVGARLLFGDRRVQHGGVSPEQTVGYTMFRGLPYADHGYLSFAAVTRNCSAVTAACMLTQRELFISYNGFDENSFGVAFNDIDYCLRVRESGRRVVYCGEAELFHHEGTSRPKQDRLSEIAAFKDKYKDYTDPYFNVNLSRHSNRMEMTPLSLPLRLAKRRKNVLFVSHNFNQEGAPNSLFEIIQGLMTQDRVRVTVVGPAAGPLMAAYREIGVEVIIEPLLSHALKVSTSEEYDARCRAFGAACCMENYDVVFANTAEMHVAINAARLARVPSVWCIREGESWNGYYSKLSNGVEIAALKSFMAPYRVVFVSKASFESWSELNTHGNFVVVPNGLNLERFERRLSGVNRDRERRKLGFLDSDVVILALGGLIPRKGQHDLILALPRLPMATLKNIQVIIVGARNNTYYERIVKAIESFPDWLRDRIMIVPESTNVGRFFVVSDIFFCGSRMESYPRIILEAEAAGLPIITTPTAGIPEQVRDGVNGLFYSPGRLEQLCGHLELLINSEESRKQMGTQSRLMLKTLLSYDEMLRAYGNIIDEAAISSVEFGHRVDG